MLSEVDWLELINGERDYTQISRERVRLSMIHGIPPHIRGEIWCIICQTKAEAQHHGTKLYKKLLNFSDSVEEYKISKDLRRTLPDLKYFSEDHNTGQNKLFNVLKAYACYDNEIGYA